MFPDSAIFAPANTYTGQRGGVNPTFDATIRPVACALEPNINTSRRDENASAGMIMGCKLWDVFTPTNPGAVVDSEVLATHAASGSQRTLRVKTKSTSSAAVLWKTECEEVT